MPRTPAASPSPDDSASGTGNQDQATSSISNDNAPGGPYVIEHSQVGGWSKGQIVTDVELEGIDVGRLWRLGAIRQAPKE